MSTRVLVNGSDDARIAVSDRGLLYGDGLFETIRFVRGVAPLWSRHMQRLREGCARLGLAAPDAGQLAAEARHVLDGDADAVVRITVTRGTGERGYAPSATLAGTRIVAAFALPALPADWYRHGIRVRSCGLRLARQPRLAGIKHLNRLEQVLARMEWSDPDRVEGLLFDTDENLVCATAANVFGVLDGVPVTPALDQCGVAGVLRAELLEAFPDTRVGVVTKEASMRMDEMFLCSSVRGVLPVREVDGRPLRIGAATRAAQSHWRALGFDGARE
ncbi:MAG: aminodeoxychorismate lyase [Rhodanobacteraceae bacterium]|nr:MAG: aminodeoxychorismate lyase [Rhodanobacteraceae bacterium]